MNREDYPKNWPQDVIDALEKFPRWQEYFFGDFNPVEILDEWSIHHGALVEAVDTLAVCGVVDRNSPLFGVIKALKHSMTALGDIKKFVSETRQIPPEPEEERPDSDSSDKIVSLKR